LPQSTITLAWVTQCVVEDAVVGTLSTAAAAGRTEAMTTSDDSQDDDEYDNSDCQQGTHHNDHSFCDNSTPSGTTNTDVTSLHELRTVRTNYITSAKQYAIHRSLHVHLTLIMPSR